MHKALLFETNYWQIYLSSDQKYFGRTLVLLKRDCGHLSALTEEEQKDFFEIVKKIEHLFTQTFGATMFNWTCLMNNAYKSDPPTPHVHWHVRPRYKNPIVFNGQTYTDPNFASHYLRGEENVEEVSEEMLNNIVEELKRNL